MDGSYHEVDSSEMAFKIAAGVALREGALKAKPVLLEPVMSVEVVTPEEYMGDVIKDLSLRRARILGFEDRPAGKLVVAECPLQEMFGYATTLRSSSQGRANYSMKFSHYAEIPASMTGDIMGGVKKSYSFAER